MAVDLSNLWDKILEHTKQEIGERAFENWFAQTRLASITEESLIIEVPSNFFKDWIYDHYRDVLNISLLKTIGKVLPVQFEVKEGSDIPPRKLDAKIQSALKPGQQKTFYLNPRYTFEGFVVGSSNRFAHAATMAIAEAPAKAYNPLFIYGGVGLGKTHLMQASCHYISETNKDLRLFYTPSESFTNELISSIQNRTTAKFREKYRKVDVLLIDDIHFIAGKEATQEEFFHTFNALYDAHKQIVLSSDRSPKAIPGLEARLVSRFEWGLVTDVQPPDLETRIAILKKKAERNSISLPDDILYFIAERIKTNIRELEGALIKVIAYASLENKPVSMDLVKEVLRDVLLGEEKKISVELIQKKVADYFDMKVSDMKAKKRSKQVAYPRQVAMYITREMTNMTLPDIGEHFGGRDHSTVIHAYGKIHASLKKNQNVKNLINRLMLEIKS
ncbi:MAG: chromosomal replication initiator protein DnaA [Candidatus Omnitrophica bacterium]|nr:chromosomal replication initiator protein DnaA [Candidatus Omnitrophota bacterium]MBU4149234.1 chromosomal replication initiator protein DnaA [Candidatus Omnitrophota bacterium]